MRRFLALLATASALTFPAAAAELTIPIDETRIMKLSAPAATVIVGNPSIADITMQGPDMALIVGKSFGATNIIALDASGTEIAQFNIVVSSSRARTVTLLRGREQQTFSCAPRCERTVTPGDSNEAFQEAAAQVDKKTTMGAGAVDASGQGQ